MIQVGKPVLGTELVGREKEIKEILAYLKMGQSVVLIAPRRFGKTSLVLEVLNRLQKEKNYTAFVDIFLHNSLSELSKTIISEVLANNGLKDGFEKAKDSVMAMMKNVELKAVINDFEFLLGLNDPKVDDWENFKQSIDFIDQFSEKAGKKMYFSFDEYGDILKLEHTAEIIKMMRAKIQRQKASTYIFSGSYESVMNSLFVDNKSPFYRLARVIHLGYIEFAALKAQFTRKLKALDCTIDNKLIENTIDFLKGHPYYTQLALQQIYIYNITKGKNPSFDELLDIIITTDIHYLEKLWQDLSSNRESLIILKHLSENTTGIYSIASEKKINASRALNNLIGQGVLYKEEGKYLFYDPVFQYWIAANIKV